MKKRAEDRAHHFTYRVTCTSTNRVFYGIHSTDCAEDGFAGAGSSLNESKKDHGVLHHDFERLLEFATRKECKVELANLKASQLVNSKKPGEYEFHFVYMTVRDDGKFYIGVHSTNNKDDRYLGSGSYLARSVRKYGRKAHKREILEMCHSREHAFERETAIITDEVLCDPLCMNLGVGGGSSDRVYGVTEETSAKISAKMKGRKITWADKIGAAHKGKIVDPEIGRRHSEKMKDRTSKPEHTEARTAGQLSSEKFKQRYRPLLVDGVLYKSGCAAVEALKIPGSTLHYRLTAPHWTSYRWADQPEKMPVQMKRGPYKRAA